MPACVSGCYNQRQSETIMQTSTLVKHSLTHYWRTNLAVILGVATAVAVLAGALLVGDSVRASLRGLFLSRLGNTDDIITANGFFREQLAADLKSAEPFAQAFRDACPLIIFEGQVRHETNKRLSKVSVYGVDERFWKFHGIADRQIAEGGTLISKALADELGGAIGDTLLLTFEKPSAIHSESLHGRKDETGRTARLALQAVLAANELGEFSVRPQQGEVRAVFVSLRRLQKDLEQANKANAILVSENKEFRIQSSESATHIALLENLLREKFALEDVGLKLRVIASQQQIAVETASAILSETLEKTIRETAKQSNVEASGIFTYLANSIRKGDKAIPYSVVCAVEEPGFENLAYQDANVRAAADAPGRRDSRPLGGGVILNEWAARDLDAKIGDIVEVEYYLWKDEGRLATQQYNFYVTATVPIAGAAADRDLTPDYPGITESESMSDWDPPFPVDLSRIRQKDEDYWHEYKTTPKAFLTLKEGQQLWQSRFGNLTSIRLTPPNANRPESLLPSFGQKLREAIDPLTAGLVVFPTRADGLQASQGATDFGEYFAYFSFFLVASALLLTVLFFKLGIEQRLREIGLLRAIGFAPNAIRAIFLKEGFLLAAIGSVIGLLLGIAYAWLMMFGLRTWWVGAVGTTLLELHIALASLIYGAAGGIVAALICIALTLRALQSASPRSLLVGSAVSSRQSAAKASVDGSLPSSRLYSPLRLAIVLALLGCGLLGLSLMGTISQTAGFFGAGFALLVAALFYQAARLGAPRRGQISGSGLWPVSRLGIRNVTYRPGRSVLCIALIASATFIIVAVEAFRRDGVADATDKRSGTGGYPLMAESLLPLISNPNTEEGRESLNLYSDANFDAAQVSFARFRLRPGEDASCLNLYQPRSPRLLAPTPDFIAAGRFAFQSSLAETDEEKSNPWLLLDKPQGDGAVPIITDANSLTYVLHRSIGDEFLFAAEGAEPIRMRIVGALADSVFQSELLMSEANFKRLFPDYEGYRVFLIDAPAAESSRIATKLEDQLSDYGFDVTATGERLAAFHRVENTYLSTFQTLGGLGLLLGTMGLATVLLRNVLERRRELALLRSVGYHALHFTLMVVAENLFLLVVGLATGAVCALIAIAPALLQRGGQVSALALGGLLIFVLVVGLASSVAAVRAALRSPLLPALRAE